MTDTVLFEDNTEKTLTDNLKALLEKAIVITLDYCQSPRPAEISLTVVEPDEIQALNRDYRGIDKVTDVLSFPMDDEEIEEDISSGRFILGDIILCASRCREQAEEFGHSFEREMAYLTIHSVLHLLGYDHINPDEEKEMTQIQDNLIVKVI